MEVHHHAHSEGSGHRKKWTHYFWEFLMLFLAVFCGFLAEYQLEHKIEKEKGKEYLHSFYEDLKTDTGHVSAIIRFDEEKLSGLAGLKDCFEKVSADPGNSSCMLTLIKYASVNRPYKMTTRTLNQLANAGGFRLLKNADADSIIAYEKQFEDFDDFQNTVYQDAQDIVRSTFSQAVNFNANIQMFLPKDGQLIATFDEHDVSAPFFSTDGKKMINKFFNDLLLYYRIIYNHRRMLLNLKTTQTRLISYFSNKYHYE